MLDFDTLHINLGLDRMRKILSALGGPQLKFKSTHVAGTNGKGSVCAMLDSILREAGHKVGLFTSPHLFRWEERIKVNGKEIRNAELVTRNARIKKMADDLKIELTPFEMITVIAFEYFSAQGVEIAVVEVGMGGRLDATNVIAPLVSVITNVDLDHTEYLGDTIEKIAAEKAGIIKKGVPVVTAETKPEALGIIKSECRRNGAGCWVVGEDAGREVRSRLLGGYQRENEAVAIKVAELLDIGKVVIERGLQKTVWPGRFMLVKGDPIVIIDGAHNQAGARALIASIKELNLPGPVTFILGFQDYKDIKAILDVIIPQAGNIIFTRSDHPQAADPKDIIGMAGRGAKSQISPSVNDAIAAAKKLGAPVVIAGSLFLAAAAMKALKIKP